ncbi:hypothetical protein CHUAL_009027 [Chamberlinius hualienensis]
MAGSTAATYTLYTLENEVFQYFVYYTALMVLKMAFVVQATAFRRFQKKIFANPEDAKFSSGKVNLQDQDVERVRRIHLNDMENIYVFAIIGFLFVATNPAPYLAKLLFKVFAYSRIVHTFVYLFAVPQPSRAISFIVGFLINIYMAISVLRWAY